VEVMTAVLDNEEDEEGHLYCLMIAQDLLVKDKDKMFIEQFAKLGLFTKVFFSFSLFKHSTNYELTRKILFTGS